MKKILTKNGKVVTSNHKVLVYNIEGGGSTYNGDYEGDAELVIGSSVPLQKNEKLIVSSFYNTKLQDDILEVE